MLSEKLKTELPFHSWVCIKKKNKKKPQPLIKKDTCTPKFIAALFTISMVWKQPKCPSTDEWIKIHTHNGILLSHKNGQNFTICNNMDGLGGHCAK